MQAGAEEAGQVPVQADGLQDGQHPDGRHGRDPGRHVLRRQGQRPAGPPQQSLRAAAHHLTQALRAVCVPAANGEFQVLILEKRY